MPHIVVFTRPQRLCGLTIAHHAGGHWSVSLGLLSRCERLSVWLTVLADLPCQSAGFATGLIRHVPILDDLVCDNVG